MVPVPQRQRPAPRWRPRAKPWWEAAWFVPPLLALAGIGLAGPLSTALPGEPAAAALAAAPYALALVFGFLALRLNHATLLAAGILVVACHAAMRHDLGPLGLATADAAVVLAVLMPLSMIGLYTAGEGWGSGGLLKLLLLPVLAAALALLLRLPAAAALLRLALLPAVARWRLPLAAPLLLLCYYGLVVSLRREITIVEHAAAWFLLPLYWMLGFAAAGRPVGRVAAAPIVACSSLLVLLFVIYRLYWQRVYLDELTGVRNRRAFEERMRSLRLRYTLAMVDVDHFKSFNDKWGHAEGDNVLRRVARHLDEESGGVVYRYGGEEFAVLYLKEDAAAAAAALERMRERLAIMPFRIRKAERPRGERPRLMRPRARWRKDSVSAKVTVSVGVASAARGLRRPQDVLERADEALYRAKREGRDRVVRA